MNRHKLAQVHRGLIIGSIAMLTALSASVATAVPIQLADNSVNMFRDIRGANNVGIGQGDRFQFGADVVGGSVGTSLGASYPPTNFTVGQFGCTPLSVDPNFCSRTANFNANQIAQPWNLRFERSGEIPVVVAGPSLAGTEVAVPFPVDVTISGSGLTPTISWTVPGSFVADAVRVVIYDRNRILANGQADVIHSFPVASNLGSYTIPATLNSGRTLQFGGDYVFNVQLIDTRGDPAAFVATNSQAHILRRSSSFFSFTPLTGNGPPNVSLPTVVNGVYNFSVTNVGPNSVTFIDPFVAVGYDYAIGAGDPNFASVMLPTGIGDNLFDLFLWDGSAFVDSGIDLLGGTQFFFSAAGVDRFSIRGIETSAGLDPGNGSAFVTGLTFVRAGSFTGTMTPLVVEITVPEPAMLLLLVPAGLALAGSRRRLAAGRRPDRVL